jgi:aminopeptidase-like protein
VSAAAPAGLGAAIHRLAEELFPICRSIAGPGVRQTLDILDREIGLNLVETPSGVPALDWTVPDEWTLRRAWIRGPDGTTIVDAADCNLHVVNYSTPVRARMSLADLRPYLHSLPDRPHVVPYRTAYYARRWGFCLRHADLERLADGEYEVLIDAEHRPGALVYGEHVLRGETDREFLLSAHVCHPSLANDNCSGMAVLAHLARSLASRRRRHTYRFLFAPGAIGALVWLSRNEAAVGRIDHGLIVSCVGDGGGPTYKLSRRGDAPIDRAMRRVLAERGGPRAAVAPFSPYGYDERQYCSPGYDLPVGLFQRGAFGTFPEYHTSADNLDFIRPEHLEASHDLILAAIDIVERDWTPLNLSPKGEPQLGRRGLYGSIGGGPQSDEAMALLWVLNLADGRHSLLDMADRSGLRFDSVATAAERLRSAALLTEMDTTTEPPSRRDDGRPAPRARKPPRGRRRPAGARREGKK